VLDGVSYDTLEDLPPTPGRLLFVGLNPSLVSLAAGHYHQGSLGRRFWGRLIDAGILPRATALATADDALMAAGHGITDIHKRPSARDDASAAELRAGVGPLFQKVALWRPGAIVFIYKRAAEAVAGRPIQEPWGQLGGVALAARPCILLPSPYADREISDEGVNYLRNLLSALPP
jgi:G:T/U-mismatch repair DNA glycosylase